MRLFEINNELVVLATDDKNTTLEDPKTKVKTIIPKDPNKPGMIRKDPAGKNLVLDKSTSGEVDNTIKPGQKVQVKQNNAPQ